MGWSQDGHRSLQRADGQGRGFADRGDLATAAPLDARQGRAGIRLLVDRTSVEFFVDDGRIVQSHRVFPLAADTRIRFFSHGATARFHDVVIRELSASEAGQA